ncbi:MAG: HU family DNA-binding protein [Clostridium sp.]|nr:HU family DNA-binding protein [Clostridium sp.]
MHVGRTAGSVSLHCSHETANKSNKFINPTKHITVMPKAYKVKRHELRVGPRKGEIIYNVSPVSYGVLSSDDVARQIAAESTASPGDVKNVLDRYAYYVVENLKKGYSIELLGFGTLTLRFRTKTGVKEEKDATAAQVISLIPAFHPSYSIVNKSRIYSLIPDKITLVKYDAQNSTDAADTTQP